MCGKSESKTVLQTIFGDAGVLAIIGIILFSLSIIMTIFLHSLDEERTERREIQAMVDMVKHGADPLRARCSFTPSWEVCKLLVMKP